jgi:outer membrane receptor protein involved in Fe transport
MCIVPRPLAVALSLALSPFAWAQTSPELQTIVVSGTKRPQLEQQVSQSANVLTADELVNDYDAYDALVRLPNVSANSRGRLPTVRGVDASGVATGSGAAISGGRPRFTTYVDGVARGHSFSPDGNASLWDIRQVEVYRGSQSSTLGRNASAGAMVLTTNDPTDEREGAAQLGYRSARTAWSAAGMVNLPLNSDTAVRVTAEGLRGTNWRNLSLPSLQQRPLDDLEAQEFERVRVKGLWSPRAWPGLSVRLSHDNQRDAQSNSPDLISGPDFKRRDVNEEQTYAYFKRSNATTALQASYELGGGWILDGVLAHQRSKNRSVPPNGSGDPTQLEVFASTREVSFEPKLSYAPGKGSRTSFVAGAFLYDRKREEGGVPGSAFVYEADDDVRTYSLFGDARVQVAPALDVLLGARVESESQQRRLEGTFLGVIPASIDFDETTRQFLPKVGAEYHLTPDVAVGFIAYTGYQAPGTGVDFLGTGGAYTFGKERSRTLELTWRSQWMQRQVTANANVFRTRYKGYQLFAADAGGGFIVKNAEKATIDGLELDTSWRPRKGVSAFAQVGLLRTRMDRFDSGLNAALNGARLPQAPKYTARVGGTFELLPGLTVGGDVYRSGSYFSDIDNIDAVFVPAYTVANLNATYRWNAVSVTAYVNNVADRFYLVEKLYPDGFAPRAYAAAPRTVGLSARIDF